MTEPMRYALLADYVFDGADLHRDSAIVIEGSRIAGLVRQKALKPGLKVSTFPSGAWLAPGFIDLQVNGGGDTLFNEGTTSDGIAAIVAAHRRFGTTAMLPTLITDTDARMQAAMHAVQSLVEGEPGVLGIHFEGPFLSPEKPGVHNPAYIRRPQPHHLALLTALRGGVTLVTLAPEQVPQGFIAKLVAAGLRVALGHSMATYEQTRAAMAEGLTGFTHLFNAMRPLASRDPGPIAAALESPAAWYGLIVDGAHVHPAVLALALRGRGHPMLVTDAMPPVGGRASRFSLYGQEIAVSDGRCTRRDGTLAGSTLDMASAVRNCVRLLDMPLEKALQLAATIPAQFIGRGNLLGRLAPGYRADVVALDPIEVRVLATWVAGKPDRSEMAAT
jgi:N-acetylglucosamine-6-phosphate deacetylase